MTLRLRIVQVDVPAGMLDPAVRFWSAALSAEPVEAPGGFVHLVGATSALEVHVQPIGDGPARYHLDLEAGPPGSPGDRDAEVARLTALGAWERSRSDAGFTVLSDPAGLPFCVIDPQAAEPTPVAPRRTDRGHLDAVFIDVPAELEPASVAFWSAALGASTQHPAPPGSAYTALRGVRGPGGTVDLEVQRVGAPPRIHVDVSATNVDAEAARLQTLGATRVAEVEDWITLADPAGNLLCVVPRDDGSQP